MSDNGKKKVVVKDLGMAAYIKLQGYNLYRREGRGFSFLIEDGQTEEIEALKAEYINGPFHKFDSEILALKSL